MPNSPYDQDQQFASLRRRVADIESGDIIAGSIEALTRTATPPTVDFGASTAIAVLSVSVTPAPLKSEYFRIHSAGVVFHNSAGSPAHIFGIGLEMPNPGSATPGLVGFAALPAGFVWRYFWLDAFLSVGAAGASGSFASQSIVMFSEDIVPLGAPGFFPVAGLEGTPQMHNTVSLLGPYDLIDPTITLRADLSAIDANTIVIPTSLIVEKIIAR